MCETYALRLGDQPKQCTITVEAPGAALFHDLDTRLIVPVEQLVRNFPFGCLVGELERRRPVPLDIHHGDQSVRQNAPDRRIGRKVFETAHGFGGASALGLSQECSTRSIMLQRGFRRRSERRRLATVVIPEIQPAVHWFKSLGSRVSKDEAVRPKEPLAAMFRDTINELTDADSVPAPHLVARREFDPVSIFDFLEGRARK